MRARFSRDTLHLPASPPPEAPNPDLGAAGILAHASTPENSAGLTAARETVLPVAPPATGISALSGISILVTCYQGSRVVGAVRTRRAIRGTGRGRQGGHGHGRDLDGAHAPNARPRSQRVAEILSQAPAVLKKMPGFIKAYVRSVDALNRVVGRIAMWLVFVMMGVLLFSSGSRTFAGVSHIWVVETAQFILTAYYLLGGGYSMQLGAHVRMDLLYSSWRPRTRATVDAITALFLLFYLVVLLIGGVSSTHYAIEFGQKNYSAWAPPLAPIKIVMVIGIALMLLQVVAVFFRDLATARGEDIG
jgi:TRAP-type mannitol/chloroaromatic compound transport system permease small subunit